MIQPLVSVIVPTRDRPHSLDTAIRSALAQHYDNLEVYIVDDGSQPPVALASELTDDARVHLLRIDRPGGPAAARNLAVEHCRGELLAFLDDDDEWLPEKTERQVEVLSGAAADVSGVQCGWEFWNEDDGVAFTFVPDPQRDLRRALLERPTMAPSSVMLRRSAFVEAGGFDPTLPRMEDWDLWLRVADRHRFVLLPDVLARRRGHPGRLVAGEELPALEVMLERLRPRLAALPGNERARIELLHTINVARMQARCRRRARSLVTLIGAWRRAPRSRDVYKAIFVTFVVETPMWRATRRVRLRMRAGRPPSTEPPPVRSW